ncbi:MAG: hypothetical protein WC209_18295 [Ignavibacteriaceae bacterium]
MVTKVNSFKRPIEQYEGKDKERSNNPLVGILVAHNEKNCIVNTYQHNSQIANPQKTMAPPFATNKFDQIDAKKVDVIWTESIKINIFLEIYLTGFIV